MPCTEPPPQAIVSLQESRYGFSFVDVGISPADLSDFDQIRIEESLVYSAFGVPPEEELVRFFSEIGPNDPDAMRRVAGRVAGIAEQILLASGRETLWVSLRSFTPTSSYDTPRWHMDGRYYKPFVNDTLQYRFVLALVGPSTLFYPLSVDLPAFRKSVWRQMTQRKLMAEMFEREKAVAPGRGTAALLIGGSSRRAALHSEPPIPEARLFLSLIPCSNAELKALNGVKY